SSVCFFFQAEDGIRDFHVTGVQTCALPIYGYHGDTSRMFIVGGDGSILAKRLCQVTYECLWLGIAAVHPGARLGDIGHAVQKHRSEERRVGKECGPRWSADHAREMGKYDGY